MGLKIITSNHLQVLFNHMADHLKAAPLGPLRDEWLVVQSRGMSRWLTLSLAKRLGIAASLNFCMPKTFCFQITELLGGPEKETQSVKGIFEDRQQLAWALFIILPPLLETHAFAPVAQYLRNDPGDLKRFQLALRTAECFDNYQLYRPDMMRQWEKGKSLHPGDAHEAWQKTWWQKVLQTSVDRPLYRQIQDAINQLKTDRTIIAGLPKRLSIFGIGSLPPLFLAFIDTLATHINIAFYVVNPTYHFWGDLRSGKEQIRAKIPITIADPFENSHEILATLGHQGRDFFNLLQGMDTSGQAWCELPYHIPERDSLLHHLQADIADLVSRGPNKPAAPITVSPNDESLQIHVCHGVLREMEVIRNLILAAFEEDPDLNLQDVVVMVPNIQTYAPFIQAVFGNPVHEHLQLPFAIADQQLGDELPLARALLTLIEVITGRMAANDVLGLFEEEATRRRFEMGETDLDILRQWMVRTRTAWGKDGHHRARDFNLPEFHENSWRVGLDRLLVSYAMGDHTGLVGGLAPLGDATTSHAALLGQFSNFMEHIFRYKSILAKTHSLQQWSDILNDMLFVFFLAETDREEEALQTVRESFAILPAIAERHHYQEEVRFPLVLEPLRQLLKQEGFGTGFITGRMTFCALKPMRTIPYKLVCLAGLNDGDFPRRDQPLGFDLMAKNKRCGDRSLREDDRYLFLESLLAAQHRLILTYMGYQPANLQPSPPASVLQELMAHLDRVFLTQDAQPITKQILIHHPSQPFDERYFNECFPQFFSYDPEHGMAAKTNEQQMRTAFLKIPLEPSEPLTKLEMETLSSFWVHPARYFCRTMLGIFYPSSETALAESEPLAVNPLQGYQLDERIFECRVQGMAETLPMRLRSEGLLPPGNLGEAHFSHRYEKITALVELVKAQAFLPERDFEVKIQDTVITGRLDHITTQARFVFRPGKIQPRHWVTIWVAHLLLQVVAEQMDAIPRQTIVAGIHQQKLLAYRLQPVPEATAKLGWILEKFLAGHQSPLPLFGKTSYAYAESYWGKTNAPKKFRTIKETKDWQPGFHSFNPVREDPYFLLCFAHEPSYTSKPPIAHQPLALAFWTGLFQCREEVT